MEKLKKDIDAIVTELGYYLYDVEYTVEHGDNVLRIMIENDTFIDIDDCIKVSKTVSVLLDQDDPFNDPYNLEVTSPGAERELKTDAQIKRAVGKYVTIKTIDQLHAGDLVRYKNGQFELKVKNNKILKIEEFDVTEIRLAIKF